MGDVFSVTQKIAKASSFMCLQSIIIGRQVLIGMGDKDIWEGELQIRRQPFPHNRGTWNRILSRTHHLCATWEPSNELQERGNQALFSLCYTQTHAHDAPGLQQTSAYLIITLCRADRLFRQHTAQCFLYLA